MNASHGTLSPRRARPGLIVLSGDYEVADEDTISSDHILARKPQALLYGIRIGYPAAYRLGFGAGPVSCGTPS